MTNEITNGKYLKKWLEITNYHYAMAVSFNHLLLLFKIVENIFNWLA